MKKIKVKKGYWEMKNKEYVFLDLQFQRSILDLFAHKLCGAAIPNLSNKHTSNELYDIM